MGADRQRRTAWATGLSLLLHVLALTGMVVGLKVALPPPEDRAVELSLLPPLEPRPRPEPARRKPPRASPAPALRPHPTPIPPPETPVLPLPQTPAPATQPDAGSGPGIGPKGLLPSLSGRLGCEWSLGAPVTPEQRQTCYNNLARETLKAPHFGLNIPDAKKAQYDTHIYCRDNYRKTMSMDIPKGCLGFGK